jgi:nucleoside-diphosphate-sugar epimerase
MKTVLIVGLGDLGGWALELLARSEGVARLVTLRRSSDVGISRTQLAAVGATFQGHIKRFEEVHHDLEDVDATARLLEEVRPDVILHTASVQSPRVLRQSTLAEGVRERLRRARFAMWLRGSSSRRAG